MALLMLHMRLKEVTRPFSAMPRLLPLSPAGTEVGPGFCFAPASSKNLVA